MERAIKYAIEGGYDAWNSPNVTVHEESDNHSAVSWLSIGNFDVLKFEVLLDPLFWQALGKQQGWSDEPYQYTNEHNIYGWHVKWLMFIDHRANGGDVDSFFNNLLK
jgi:hypothetical protein